MEALIQEIEKEFGPKFDALTEQSKSLSEQLEAKKGESPDAEQVQELSKSLSDLDDAVKELTVERDTKLREAEFKSLAGTVESLQSALESAREPHSEFSLAGGIPTASQKAIYGDSAESFYHDAAKALKSNDPEAIERWTEAMGEKAMVEHTGSSGGFLVPETVAQGILELREQETTLRGLFSRISVSGDQYRFGAQADGLTAGWVAELAEKPLDDFKFGEVSVNVFTKAGLAVVSNQLLADARPSIDGLINRDLAKRLGTLEELAFLAGDGVGKPKGILHTPGVQDTELTSTDIDDTLDAIVDAITDIYTNYFGAPDGIVMHPRTWARIIKAREATSPSTYLIGAGSSAWGRRANDSLPGYSAASAPRGELFGLPVYTTRNVPINLGDTENESAIFVGNWSEGLILDRQGIALSSSEHVFFTSNQTVFRAEDRVGFTAARYPKAFNVIQGPGLANG